MTNVKEFHCHMRMNLQSYEDNLVCLALFHGTEENVQLGPSEHWTLSTKWTLQTLLVLFTAAKNRKRLF